MSVLARIGYCFKWAIYIVRVLLSWVYEICQITSKPGMRRLFPFILAGALVLAWGYIHDLAGIPADFSSGASWALDVGLFLAIWPLSWLFSLLSRAIALVIGVFPPVTKPLKPLGKLTSASSMSGPSSSTRSAVPPFKRRP